MGGRVGVFGCVGVDEAPDGVGVCEGVGLCGHDCFIFYFVG